MSRRSGGTVDTLSHVDPVVTALLMLVAAIGAFLSSRPPGGGAAIELCAPPGGRC